MDISKIAEQALKYKPKARRSIRHQKEIWTNKFHFEGYRRGTASNPSELMMMMMISRNGCTC